MTLPADSTFAVMTRTNQQAESEERSRMKELVLRYHETDRAELEAVEELEDKKREEVSQSSRQRKGKWSIRGQESL
jgi:hypothetical protein